MSIPGALMPGQGGPLPPGAGGPGGMMGPGGPEGGPEAILKLLASLQQSPPTSGEPSIFQEATNALGTLLQRVQTRSAKAAKDIADAIAKVQAAKVSLQQEATKSMAPPPDLGLSGMMPGAPGAGSPPGMGMGGM